MRAASAKSSIMTRLLLRTSVTMTSPKGVMMGAAPKPARSEAVDMLGALRGVEDILDRADAGLVVPAHTGGSDDVSSALVWGSPPGGAQPEREPPVL